MQIQCMNLKESSVKLQINPHRNPVYELKQAYIYIKKQIIKGNRTCKFLYQEMLVLLGSSRNPPPQFLHSEFLLLHLFLHFLLIIIQYVLSSPCNHVYIKRAKRLKLKEIKKGNLLIFLHLVKRRIVIGLSRY